MSNIVADMTKTEFKEMIESVVGEILERKLAEIFADPDEGMEIRKTVLNRLLEQKQSLASGERGVDFEDAARRLGFS